MGRHRKAIAASSGVLLIALLEYAATTPDVERALELIVPHGIVPLVPVLFGGLATIAAVWKASNAHPSPPADSVPGPDPAAASPPDDSPSAAGSGAMMMDPPAMPAPAPRAEPDARTSLVQLLPPPAPDYH